MISRMQDTRRELINFYRALLINNILTIAFGTRTETLEDPLVGHWLKHSREFM